MNFPEISRPIYAYWAPSFLILMLASSASASAEDFEIIDGSATVVGKPDNSQTQARENWGLACDKWKSEIKELNKKDQLMALSCESPSCTFDTGTYTCTSNAIFKIKTAGTRVQPPPPPKEIDAPKAPPQVIVETIPAPRPDYIWVGGYWGWSEHRHHWHPGHWEHRRPGYVWVEPVWHERGSNWHFTSGYWRR